MDEKVVSSPPNFWHWEFSLSIHLHPLNYLLNLVNPIQWNIKEFQLHLLPISWLVISRCSWVGINSCVLYSFAFMASDKFRKCILARHIIYLRDNYVSDFLIVPWGAKVLGIRFTFFLLYSSYIELTQCWLAETVYSYSYICYLSVGSNLHGSQPWAQDVKAPGAQNREEPTEVIIPEVLDNYRADGARGPFSGIWSRTLRIKITGRDGFEKLDVRIPVSYLSLLIALILW